MNFLQGTVRFLKFILLISSALPSAYFAKEMATASTNIAAVTDGIFLTGSLYLFGMVFSILYSGSLSRGLSECIFYPASYLPRTPVTTSRQAGLIASGDYQTAETELRNMRARYPYSPEIASMLADLHANIYGDIPQASADIAFYFLHRKLRRDRCNYELLIRYLELNRNSDRNDLVKKEIKRKDYSEHERKMLESRLNSSTV